MKDHEIGASPLSVLDGTKKERLNHFYNRRFKHRKMETLAKQVLNAIQAPERNTLVHLIGPARVGKTTLLEFILSTILKASLPLMEQDHELIPVALLEAQAPNTRSSFDFSEFYRRILSMLNEVGIVYKRTPLEGNIKSATRHRQQRWINSFNGRRDSLQQVLTQRRLETLLIDESHTMTLTSAQMQETTCTQLKSLANITRVPIVLCGTYELTSLSKYEAQIIGRTALFHFSRYHPALPQDLLDFQDIVCELVYALPMHEEMGDVPPIDFFCRWIFRISRSLEAVDVTCIK